MKKTILMALTVAVAMVACKKDDSSNSNPSNTYSSTKTFKVKYGASVSYGLFRFSDSSIRPNSDSATTNWDFGFIHSNYIPNIFFNSHFRGPGNAGVILQQSLFASVTTAPTSGYAYDTSATQPAVQWASWYDYPSNHLPVLKNPRTFIVKAADGGHYAKLEMLAVGYDTLVPAGGMMLPDSLKYTFRYTYQANGTTTF